MARPGGPTPTLRDARASRSGAARSRGAVWLPGTTTSARLRGLAPVSSSDRRSTPSAEIRAILGRFVPGLPGQVKPACRERRERHRQAHAHAPGSCADRSSRRTQRTAKCVPCYVQDDGGPSTEELEPSERVTSRGWIKSGSDETWFRPTRARMIVGLLHGSTIERRRRVAGANRMTLEEVVKRCCSMSTLM